MLADQQREVFGLPIDVLLTDVGWSSLANYMATMALPITSRRQWGGFMEAVIMGQLWQMQVAFFLELHAGGNVKMMTEPVGTGERGRICLLWRGSHYELLSLSDLVWARCSAQ